MLQVVVLRALVMLQRTAQVLILRDVYKRQVR